MSNNLRNNDDAAHDKNSPFRRRRLWLVTAVAGLAGAVSLTGVAYATTGVTGSHRLTDVKWSTAQLVGDDDQAKDQVKDDKGKDDKGKDDKGKDDKDKDDKDKDDKDDRDRVREVECDDDALVEALDLANRDDGGTLKLAKDCTYELDQHDKKSEAGLPTIKQEITIEGNGATIKREAEEGFRIFRVANGGDLTLKDVEVRNGAAGEDRKDDKRKEPPKKA
ncbi:hypothetical protein ACWD50_06660, partial [Micromonospora sp. NPDC005113]